MRILLGAILVLAPLGSASALEPGSLDPTFGTDGVVTTASTPDSGQVALQADGKILLAHARGTSPDLVVARYDSTGALDPSWGGTGEISGPSGAPDALAVLPDGEVLVVSSGMIRRYTTTGAPSPTWGVGGVVALPVSHATGVPRPRHPVAVQPDGRIVVAGTSAGSFAVARLLPDGTLDASFGGTGLVTTPIASSEAVAVLVQEDGAIVAAGEDGAGLQIARYTPTGGLDGTFGTGGVATMAPFGTAAPDTSVELLQQADGKLILAASDGPAPFEPGAFLLVRLATDGSLDTTFGTGGIQTTEAFLGVNRLFSAILQEDGKIVALGGTIFLESHALLVRYTDTGAHDTQWSPNARIELEREESLAFFSDGVRQPDGKLVAVVPTDQDLLLVRIELSEFCGDGLLQSFETCDDTNVDDGDCCSGTCQLDAPGAACTSDGNTCTTDTCDAAGSCTHVDLPDGSACDDGLVCSIGETCAAGACLGGTPGGTGCANPFVCYKTRGSRGHSKFPGSAPLALADEIESGLFEAKNQAQLCVPAEVNATPVMNPDVRRLAYKLKTSKGEPKHEKLTGVEVADRFGTHRFDTKRPDLLLTPAHLELGSPAVPPAPGVADSFKCYKVKESKDSPGFIPTVMTATDEFEDRRYTVFSPRRICLPVDTNAGGIVDASTGLTCYRIRRFAGEPSHEAIKDLIHTADPLGDLRIDTKAEQDLCVIAEIVDVP